MSMSHLYGMDRDDGVEMQNFEMSDWDLQKEFNLHQQQHRQTKEEATYGMWAEHDSDEEQPSFGGKCSRGYLAPMSFISAGLRKTAAKELLDKDLDDEEKPVKQEESPKKFVPKKLKTGGDFKPSHKGFIGGSKSFVHFGSWERHTKGIGQKLLQKMGYIPGRGLGKNAQGIINPIKAKQRKGKGAVGTYGSERTPQSLQDFPVADSEEEAEEKFQKLSQWRKDPNRGKKKPKYSYATVEELKAKGRISKKLAAPQKELSQVKVIDMTGREQKVYYSYSQISHKHNIPDDSPQQPLGKDSKPQGFALPELEHNLQLLINITEQEIVQSDQQLCYERDMVVILSHEIQKMAEVLSHEEKAISNLSKVLDMVEECERRMQPGCENPLTLDECAKIFETLQDKAFMVKNIVPKLGMCLNELIINPHQQHMDAFYWVIDWEGMISVSSLVGLLEKHFFPKWLQVLCSWLSNSPNYEEITKWYLGWKSMFSDQVLAHPSIKDKFNEALDIMNWAVSSSVGGYMQPGARENIAYLTHTERHKDFQYEAVQERHEAENTAQRGIGTAAGSVPVNFKDLIQTKAEEHNIVFVPVIGKRHKGKQLYAFGRIVIYINRGVGFVQGEMTWVPTSLQSLIDMAK
ncbi:TFP11 protein, partial [Cnemophilus loriae]|nr:TFP11 protein [Cnemophilus loriae]